MKLKTQFLSALVLLLAVGLLWENGPLRGGSVDTDDDGKIRYTLIVTSTEEDVFITGAAHTGKQGRIFRHESKPVNEPWHLEFITDADDSVAIELSPHAEAVGAAGFKVWVQCRIVVDGVERSRHRDERVTRKMRTSLAAYCRYNS